MTDVLSAPELIRLDEETTRGRFFDAKLQPTNPFEFTQDFYLNRLELFGGEQGKVGIVSQANMAPDGTLSDYDERGTDAGVAVFLDARNAENSVYVWHLEVANRDWRDGSHWLKDKLNNDWNSEPTKRVIPGQGNRFIWQLRVTPDGLSAQQLKINAQGSKGEPEDLVDAELLAQRIRSIIEDPVTSRFGIKAIEGYEKAQAHVGRFYIEQRARLSEKKFKDEYEKLQNRAIELGFLSLVPTMLPLGSDIKTPAREVKAPPVKRPKLDLLSNQDRWFSIFRNEPGNGNFEAEVSPTAVKLNNSLETLKTASHAARQRLLSLGEAGMVSYMEAVSAYVRAPSTMSAHKKAELRRVDGLLDRATGYNEAVGFLTKLGERIIRHLQANAQPGTYRIGEEIYHVESDDDGRHWVYQQHEPRTPYTLYNTHLWHAHEIRSATADDYIRLVRNVALSRDEQLVLFSTDAYKKSTQRNIVR